MSKVLDLIPSKVPGLIPKHWEKHQKTYLREYLILNQFTNFQYQILIFISLECCAELEIDKYVSNYPLCPSSTKLLKSRDQVFKFSIDPSLQQTIDTHLIMVDSLNK
jgi:hypothetical protein